MNGSLKVLAPKVGVFRGGEGLACTTLKITPKSPNGHVRSRFIGGPDIDR